MPRAPRTGIEENLPVKLKLLAIWRALRQSFWFVPGLMSLAAVALAFVMLTVDSLIVGTGGTVPRYLPSGDAAGARSILSTIAGSAITVAGVVFSITIAVLSTAAAQYGPRLLPNFMNQHGTQIVLGGFVGTFIYCLLVLSQVRTEALQPVPQYALSMGLLLGVASFALLIFFIHHVAMFIQVPRILADVGADLEHTIVQTFPEGSQAEPDDDVSGLEGEFDDTVVEVTSRRSGYLQAIDYDALVQLAAEQDWLVKVDVLPGHYLLHDQTVMQIRAAGGIDEEPMEQLHGIYLLGDARTSFQDPEFAVDQMVEIALRALSPGINDPFTAINCIDRLTAALRLLAGRELPSRVCRDSEGRARLLRRRYDFDSFMAKAFNQLRQNARDNAAVAICLLQNMAGLARFPAPPAYREALRRHAELLYHDAREAMGQAADREDFRQRYRDFQEAIERPERPG